VERLGTRVEEEIAARAPATVWLACSRALPSMARSELHGQLEAYLAHRQQELSVELERHKQQLTEAAQAEMARLEERAQEQQALADQLAQAREELQTFAAEMQRQLSKSSTRIIEAGTTMEARLKEVGKIRDQLESLQRLLPQTLDQRLEKGVAVAVERLRACLEEQIVAQTRNQSLELNRQVAEISGQLGGELRQKLIADIERHEREFLDRIGQRLEETLTVEGNVREQVNQMLADLQSQVEEQLSGRQRDLNAELEERSQQLAEVAANTAPQLEKKLWSRLEERLQADFRQRLRQSVNKEGGGVRPALSGRKRLYTWVAFLAGALILGWALLPTGTLKTGLGGAPAAESQAGAGQPLAAETQDQPRFAVQVATYAKSGEAEALAQSLASAYQQAVLVDTVEVNGETLYRVRLPTETEEEAQSLAEQLGANQEFEPQVTPFP
jgi:hypothetical protein